MTTNKTRFSVRFDDGVKSWKFWRDENYKCWMLETHDGCLRALAANWIDSVPQIRIILENYGGKADIS